MPSAPLSPEDTALDLNGTRTEHVFLVSRFLGQSDFSITLTGSQTCQPSQGGSGAKSSSLCWILPRHEIEGIAEAAGLCGCTGEKAKGDPKPEAGFLLRRPCMKSSVPPQPQSCCTWGPSKLTVWSTSKRCSRNQGVVSAPLGLFQELAKALPGTVGRPVLFLMSPLVLVTS